MSKNLNKYDNLPKLQSKIVLCLAKEGPMLIGDTNTKIHGEYTSTNRAFHDLVGKGLIEHAGQVEYRKRVFPKYWLTVRGSGWALLNGAKPEYIKENALKSNTGESEQKAIDVYFKLRTKASPGIARIFDEFILRHGKLETRELIKALLPAMLSVEPSETDKLMNVAREFPEWKYTKATLEKMREKIDRVLSHE